jgi:hypothetical protein
MLDDNDRLGMEAAALGVKGLRPLKATDGDSLEQIEAKNRELAERAASRAAESDAAAGTDQHVAAF